MTQESSNFVAAETRFSLLAYNANEWREVPTGSQVIIIALLDPKTDRLLFRVRRDWSKVILAEHSDYVRSLLADFQQRASGDPTGLFHQVCSLNVGPLQTFRSGLDIAADPDALLLCREFVSL